MRPKGDYLLVIPRSFITLTEDTHTALFLSQLVYWSDRCSNPEGWVYKSHDEWKQELGLSRRYVDRARRRLVELGLLEQTCRMVNNRRTMHFRIRREALRRKLNELGVDDRDQDAEGRPEGPENATAADSAVCQGGAHRPGGKRQTGVTDSVTPKTETTAESTPETTAYISPCGCKQPQPPTATAEQLQGNQSTGIRGETGTVSLLEFQVEEVLKRLPAFASEASTAAVQELRSDYPDEATVLEIKKFVAYWQDRRLRRPWVALRNWLDCARRREQHYRTTAELHSTLHPGRSRRPGRGRELPRVYTAPPIYGDEVEVQQCNEANPEVRQPNSGSCNDKFSPLRQAHDKYADTLRRSQFVVHEHRSSEDEPQAPFHHVSDGLRGCSGSLIYDRPHRTTTPTTAGKRQGERHEDRAAVS